MDKITVWVSILLVVGNLQAGWFDGGGDGTRLSSSDLEAIEQGKANSDQKFKYIAACANDNVCRYAMMEAWNKDTSEYSMQAVSKTVPEQKIGSLFKGTDIATTMRVFSLINKCNIIQACQDNLVGVVRQVRSLPKDMLLMAYRDKANIDRERLASQIQNNYSTSIAKARGRAYSESSVARTENSRVATSNNSEGKEVVDFFYDAQSGDKIYLNNMGGANQEIVYYPGGDKNKKKKLADVFGKNSHYLVETVTGETIEVSSIHLTHKGFVASSRESLYGYAMDTGLAKYTIPSGFHAAGIQVADAFKTGYMLLERDVEQDKINAVGSSLSAIGAILGANRKMDYALLDLHRGKLFPINVDNNGKTVTQLYNCHKKNDYFNVCRNGISREALRDRYGMKNARHYAWRIRWYKTPRATYLLAMENGKDGLTATRLEDGKKVQIAFRSLGIADWASGQDDSGKVWIDVRKTFTRKRYTNDLDADFNRFANGEQLARHETAKKKERAEAGYNPLDD